MCSQETESDDESEGREAFVKGSAIAQAKSLQRKQKKYGDSFVQGKLDRLSLMGFSMSDLSDAGGAGSRPPTLRASTYSREDMSSTSFSLPLFMGLFAFSIPRSRYVLGDGGGFDDCRLLAGRRGWHNPLPDAAVSLRDGGCAVGLLDPVADLQLEASFRYRPRVFAQSTGRVPSGDVLLRGLRSVSPINKTFALPELFVELLF